MLWKLSQGGHLRSAKNLPTNSILQVLRPIFGTFAPGTLCITADQGNSGSTGLDPRITEAIPNRVNCFGELFELLYRILALRAKHLLIGNCFLDYLKRHAHLAEVLE